MREWLLKDEKAKVGRPKLADSDVLKKAKVTMLIGFALSFVFFFSFMSMLMNTTPTKLAYKLTVEKLFGALENKNGFLVKDYYDDNKDYVMEFNVPGTVDNYSGSYKYTLYELDGKSWKEKETKSIDRGTKSFKIKVPALKNENKTWKVKLQIVNASKIDKSYAPGTWSFVDAKNNSDKYAYKVFTVKGYYSPISVSEEKEAVKNKNKISVITEKENPRELILNFPEGLYDVKISYTDSSSKNVILASDNDVSVTKRYVIPNSNRVSKVTIKVYGSNVENLKLSNWKEETDKKENSYITNTYVLKPEKAYKN